STIPAHGIDMNQLGDWLKSLQNIRNRSYQKNFIAIHGYPNTLTPDYEGGIQSLKAMSSSETNNDIFIQAELKEGAIWTMSIPQSLKKLLDSYFVGASILPSTFGICKHILEDNHHISQLNLH